MIHVAIVTVSDKASRGERADAGGPAIRETLEACGLEAEVVDYRVVADEAQDIAEALFHLSERADVELILTTGGTGLAPRDVTPQIPLLIGRQFAGGDAPRRGNAGSPGSDGASPEPHPTSAGAFHVALPYHATPVD